jgi:ribosomal 50S subunit-recycling heat shock protein
VAAVAFSIDETNRVRQLVELSATVEPTDDPDRFDLNVTLLLQPDEIEVGDYTVLVGFSEAFVSLETFGCEADRATKFGMRRVAESGVRTQSTEKSVKATVSRQVAHEAVVKGKISLVDNALELGGKASETSSQTTDVTLTVKEEHSKLHIPVESIGNDRWLISEETGSNLTGYYLSYQRLCHLVKRRAASNRFGASLSFRVKRRDIEIQVVDNRSYLKLNKTKEKLLAILLGKFFDSSKAERDNQAITFSETVIDDQGQ